MIDELLYQPFYCEENIWQLGQRPEVAELERYAVFVGSDAGLVPLFAQRAGRESDGLVFWDYHVVLLVQGEREQLIFDLDCRLGAPLGASVWIQASIPDLTALPEPYHPRFRVVPFPRFLETFSSDRSHMLEEDGSYKKPAPPWDAPVLPETPSNVLRFADMSEDFVGRVLSVEALLAGV
jgi:hypothetical protein